jgi:hypothetical protein
MRFPKSKNIDVGDKNRRRDLKNLPFEKKVLILFAMQKIAKEIKYKK